MHCKAKYAINRKPGPIILDREDLVLLRNLSKPCTSVCAPWNRLFPLYMTLRSNFPNNRINFILWHKLLPCLQQRLLQVYGKMFIHTTDGIVVEILFIIILIVWFNLILFYSYDVVIPLMSCVLYFISFHFIMFILSQLDVMGNYVLRSYDVINLSCLADGISKNLFLLC